MTQQLLSELGIGFMESVAYDTAWIARISDKYPEFAPAFDWLRSRQHADGSWGSDAFYYHDRVISTLSAVIALHEGNQPQDAPRIEKGLQFLWENYQHLDNDPHDTIGFAVLLTSLTKEALDKGLNVPRLNYKPEEVAQKLKLFSNKTKQWRRVTMAFSLEVWANHLNPDDDIDFLEDNGSIGASPAATAAILSRCHNDQAYEYLSNLYKKQNDGGVPDNDPIDVFEIAWSLNYLRIANVVSPDDLLIQKHLNYLMEDWVPDEGIGHSRYFAVKDLDDTALAFTVLNWGGCPVDIAPFGTFEIEDGFRCFHHEASPSLSAHLHMLMALHSIGLDESHPWVSKALAQIHHWNATNEMWFDKWHASPYYLVISMTEALTDYAPEIAEARIRWILENQREDGGWGYYEKSTPEESAYAMLALLRWSQKRTPIADDILQRGADYLHTNRNTPQTPLWIGKCLYTPKYVVKTAVHSALHLFEHQISNHQLLNH